MKHFPIKSAVGLASFAILASAFPVFAQNANPFGNRDSADTSVSYKPPAVFVTKINLEPITNSAEIKGRFMVWNNDNETIGGLLYRIDLLDPLPPADQNSGTVEDTATLYDRFVSGDQFVLAPNERKEIVFTYQPPLLPTGNYRIQITATDKHGRDMGWWNADLSLTNQKHTFLKLVTGPLLSPEYPDRKFPSQAGPNITPEKNISLNATAINGSSSKITIVPKLDIYEFDIARGKTETVKGKESAVLANAAKEISLPVVAASKPGVYYGLLYLTDGKTQQKISNLAEYRWVVKGEHAEIVSIRIIKAAIKKDAEMMVRVDLVGSADAFTKTKANLNVVIKDRDGIVGSIDAKGAELTDGVASTQGPIKLSRDLKASPEIIATLTDQKGTQVDQTIIPLTNDPASAATLKNSLPVKIGIVILLLIGAVLIVIKKLFQKPKKM